MPRAGDHRIAPDAARRRAPAAPTASASASSPSCVTHGGRDDRRAGPEVFRFARSQRRWADRPCSPRRSQALAASIRVARYRPAARAGDFNSCAMTRSSSVMPTRIMTSKSRSASRAAERDRSTPMRSMGSSVSVRPAVSTRWTATPPRMSALLDGVARRAGDGRHDRALVAQQRVEQARLADVGPAQGSPRAAPCAAHARAPPPPAARQPSSAPRRRSAASSAGSGGGTSSSGKSMCASMRASAFMAASRADCTRAETSPRSWR